MKKSLEHVTPLEVNLSGYGLTRNSSGDTRPQSSQLAEPLWTDFGLQSWISLRGLISIFFFFLSAAWGMNCRTFSSNPRTWGKATTAWVSHWNTWLYLTLAFACPYETVTETYNPAFRNCISSLPARAANSRRWVSWKNWGSAAVPLYLEVQGKNLHGEWGKGGAGGGGEGR